jgi:hypothetical protein
MVWVKCKLRFIRKRIIREAILLLGAFTGSTKMPNQFSFCVAVGASFFLSTQNANFSRFNRFMIIWRYESANVLKADRHWSGHPTIHLGGNMNSLRTWIALFTLTLGLLCMGPCALAQSEKPAGDSAQAPSATASKAEVDQLRQELAAQRRTIEQLKNLVEQLVEVKSRAPSPSNDGAARLINTSYPLPAPPAIDADAAAPAEPVVIYQNPQKERRRHP